MSLLLQKNNELDESKYEKDIERINRKFGRVNPKLVFDYNFKLYLEEINEAH